MSFLDIINGDYDCAGNSQDGCPLGSLDCPIVNPSGMIVDYFHFLADWANLCSWSGKKCQAFSSDDVDLFCPP